jgi:nucleotide-binding universal stress UspA family protein
VAALALALVLLPRGDMRIRRLLVPVDFSSRSRVTVEYAIGLAALVQAEVHVLHVVPAPGPLHIAADVWLGRPVPRPSALGIAVARERLEELMTSCDRGDVVPILRVAAGDAAATIVRLAVELAVDGIVMGTRSHKGLAGVALGSVAQRVIACAPCPVVALGREVLQQHAAA